MLKALAVPALASLGLLVVFALAMSLTGVTRISIPVARMPSDAMLLQKALQVDALRMAPDRERRCGEAAGVLVVLEQAPWRDLPGDAGLRAAGLQPCASLFVEYNVPPNASGGAGPFRHGAPAMLGLGALAALLVSVYVRFARRDGLPTFSLRPHLPAAAGALACLGALGLLSVRLDIGVWGSGASLASLPNAIAAAALVPLIEELAFRAWFIEYARRSIGATGAVVTSALLFALIHVPADALLFAYYVATGLVLAIAWFRTRSLATCVVAHGAYNAVLLLT